MLGVLTYESHGSQHQRSERLFCTRRDLYTAFSQRSPPKTAPTCQYPLNVGIRSEDPNVSQRSDPHYPSDRNRKGTVYTQLRNELAHKRAGVNLEDTKYEMGQRLPGLIALTQRAIIRYG
jgi:hypothetical protein